MATRLNAPNDPLQRILFLRKVDLPGLCSCRVSPKSKRRIIAICSSIRSSGRCPGFLRFPAARATALDVASKSAIGGAPLS